MNLLVEPPEPRPIANGARLAAHATEAPRCSLFLATLGALLLATACNDSVVLRDVDGGAGLDAAGGDAAASDAAGGDVAVSADASTEDSPFRTDDAGRVLCGGEPCACDDGLDDDGDGLVDGADPECTGPYDDDEATFATGIPGDNRDGCQDCFFDGNSGQGDDGCRYDSECLYGREPARSGACGTCEVSTACVDFCGPRVPNGCDCFGCCEVRRGDGSTVNVLLAEGCSLSALDDEAACARCVPSADCQNPCGRCELCLGRTVDDLPEDCGATYTCDEGQAVCSDAAPCEPSEFCHQGCCLPALI